MIRFSCKCGNVLSVETDQAGGEVQCQVCGLLNDVPLHRDLANLAVDGTFKLGGPLRKDDADRLEELGYVYGQKRGGMTPEELDLRASEEDLERVGEGFEILDEKAAATPPKYDPETGELIPAIDLAPRVPRPVIPMATALPAGGAIRYAQGGFARRWSPKSLFVDLFQPGNAAVLAIISLFTVLGAFLHLFLLIICGFLLVASNGRFAVPPWLLNALLWLVVAHYGNVIEDVGPEEIDELPRPWRGLSFNEDIAGPLVRMVGSVALCYWPAVVVLHSIGDRFRPVALLLYLIGGLFLPAVMITFVTSRSLANLRPDRVLTLVWRGGAMYLMTAAIWTVLFPVYLFSTLGIDVVEIITRIDLTENRFVRSAYVALPLTFVAVFFAHYFCCLLGLIYRAQHDKLGWVWEELQRDRVKRRMDDGARRRPTSRPPAMNSDRDDRPLANPKDEAARQLRRMTGA